MERKVWYYSFDPETETEPDFQMPIDAQILYIIATNNLIRIYVSVPVSPDGIESRSFFAVETDEQFLGGPTALYLGSVNIRGLVYHVFERTWDK